ncbi:MAG TPA: DUF1464 family protein [Gemmatimonadales bacterium]
MPRVVGIDPGTVSLDLCGLDDGRVFLDASQPTAEAIADAQGLLAMILGSGPVDLVVGPSGYGMPVTPAVSVTDADLQVAFLSRRGDAGGIVGIGRLARQLGQAGLPVVFIPGVILLDTVPKHRKLNRVDMGTADKVSAAALAIHEESRRLGCDYGEVSLILLELGGAFTAGLAVHRGQVMDGVGGSGGPIGWRAAGGWDAEVAFLAGEVSKGSLFQGGVETVLARRPAERDMAIEAYTEGAARLAVQLLRSAPDASEILLSGRHADEPAIKERIAEHLAGVARVRPLEGFAAVAKQGAQGAALIADGLAGGTHRPLVEHMRLREAKGTVLDYLYVVPPETARARLGLDR